MTIRSITLSLTAAAVSTILIAGCAQPNAPTATGSAYTPVASSMGNAARDPVNTASDTNSSNRASDMVGTRSATASDSTVAGTGTATGTSAAGMTGMAAATDNSRMATTTDSNANITDATRASASAMRDGNGNVMRAARADRN